MPLKYMTYPFPLLQKRRRQVRNVTQDDMSRRRGVCMYMHRKLRRRRRRRPTLEALPLNNAVKKSHTIVSSRGFSFTIR